MHFASLVSLKVARCGHCQVGKGEPQSRCQVHDENKQQNEKLKAKTYDIEQINLQIKKEASPAPYRHTAPMPRPPPSLPRPLAS